MASQKIIVATLGSLQFDLNHTLAKAAKGCLRSKERLAKWFETPEGEEYHKEALRRQEENKKHKKQKNSKKPATTTRRPQSRHRRSYDDPGMGLRRAAREAWLARQATV